LALPYSLVAASISHGSRRGKIGGQNTLDAAHRRLHRRGRLLDVLQAFGRISDVRAKANNTHRSLVIRGCVAGLPQRHRTAAISDLRGSA